MFYFLSTDGQPKPDSEKKAEKGSNTSDIPTTTSDSICEPQSSGEPDKANAATSLGTNEISQ